MATATATSALDGTRRSKPDFRPDGRPPEGSTETLASWLRAQAINVTRHAASLRPFRREEFGTGAAAPSDGHLQAANQLISKLRKRLLKKTKDVSNAVGVATREPSSPRLRRGGVHKERAQRWVQGIEKIWDFYLELFGQRQSMPYADWLLSCDRIALDCYQAAYTGVGTTKSIPAPPPFCFMRTGFAPATMRRGIRLRKLGKQLNPFPLIQLPHHRLTNPWTLGAVMHEVSHNLQTELGLSREVPRRVARRLLDGDLGQTVAATWARWNREMFADMSAVLLGGPEVVASLMDVVGRAPATVYAFNPRGVHPTPYLRTMISTELLRRMGFEDEAERFRGAWLRIYGKPPEGAFPSAMLKSFPRACALAVDSMCYKPYRALGGKSLTQVIRFERKDQHMIEEAARRLAAGVDPGVISARYLIGATRVALDRRLARPGTITENFYKELVRR